MPGIVASTPTTANVNRSAVAYDDRGGAGSVSIAGKTAYDADHYAASPLEIATNVVWNTVAVNPATGYPTQKWTNNRAGIVMRTASGSAAVTDGFNRQYCNAALKLEANKPIRVILEYHFEDANNAVYAGGVGAISSLIINTDPQDFLQIRKEKGSRQLVLRARKAGGTAENTTLAITNLSDNVWYRTEFIAARDATQAGKGTVVVYHGTITSGGTLSDLQRDYQIATQFPDTNHLAPYQAWQVGRIDAQVNGTLGYMGVKLAE